MELTTETISRICNIKTPPPITNTVTWNEIIVTYTAVSETAATRIFQTEYEKYGSHLKEINILRTQNGGIGNLPKFGHFPEYEVTIKLNDESQIAEIFEW